MRVQAQCKRSASAVQAQCKRSARTGVQTRVGRVRVGVLGVRGGCRCVSGRARRGLRGLRAHHVPTRTLSPSPPRSHHPQSLCFESRAAHNGSPADPAVRGDATCLWRSASGTSPQRRGWWWGDAYNRGDRHTSAESGKGQTVVVGWTNAEGGRDKRWRLVKMCREWKGAKGGGWVDNCRERKRQTNQYKYSIGQLLHCVRPHSLPDSHPTALCSPTLTA
jgi:hypothetical protein